MSKHPFDVYVGAKLVQCRTSARMTRQQLGARLGVDARRIRDFEAGVEPISPGLMRSIVAELNVPPAYFFAGLAEALRGAA
jgi:transcriptional regulator with XRE-family HTH domain